MIQLKNIDKYYDAKFQRTFVLKGVDLEVQQGEFISIMGSSGAGKSTLLNIIGFLDEPSQGEYLFLGDHANKLKEKQKVQYHRSHIGFIFQAFHLIEEMNVYENIETPLVYRGVKNKERKALVADMLDRFNMVAKKDRFPVSFRVGNNNWLPLHGQLLVNPNCFLPTNLPETCILNKAK